ncbi:hypothetical protein [Sandaracinus amylolyticus]|uniref:TonB C-terminal domain-containing protein n=1 Tax=Sandaracinus amylolyticus TaxID=927083 RepID=A0A0F6W9Q7_9BACT|nr:hypothetical protein [Sandaracinus amylolyticus]AKF10958.1 hypothetical protein DB32_008107 [Sandaracinus amylolyticus]
MTWRTGVLGIAIVLAGACGARDTAPPPEPPVPVPVADTPPPHGPPIPGPTARSIVRTERPFAVTGALPGAEELVERARQHASVCYAQVPSPEGVMELAIDVADDRVRDVRVVRDELASSTVLACLRERVLAMPVQGSSAASIVVAWRFASAPIDVERDCSEDRECVMVSGVCGEPVSVREAVRDTAQARYRQLSAVATCAGNVPAVTAVARCREGLCTAVPVP